MTISITFEDFKDKQPKHKQEIMYLELSYSSFGSYGYNLEYGSVEYLWEELNTKGVTTGNHACFDVEADAYYPIGFVYTSDDGSLWRLQAFVNGYLIQAGFHWIDADAYMQSMPKRS